MSVKLLTEHYLEFLSLKGGCTSSSESILDKIPHCWKSHVTAQMISIKLGLKISLRKREIVALFYLSSCCHVVVRAMWPQCRVLVYSVIVSYPGHL